MANELKQMRTDVPLRIWRSFRKQCIDSDFTATKAMRMSMGWFLGSTHEERIEMYRKYNSYK